MKLAIELRGFQDKLGLYLERFLEIRKKEPGTTIRHTYYQLLSMFEKYNKTEFGVQNGKNNEGWYKYVCKLSRIARYNGLLDWDNIVDERRYNHQINMFENPSEFKRILYNAYKKDIWNYMPTYCVILCEKDGMVDTLQPLADEYRMKLYSCAGQNSDSVNWEISQEFERYNGGVIFYFGDWDAPGYFIPHKIQWFMDKVGKKQDFKVKMLRVSLKKKQVEKHKLTTIPSKNKFKRWIKKHGNRACEIDVFDPDVLVKIARRKINKSGYFNKDIFNRVLKDEEGELLKIRNAIYKAEF